ncbi:hypothetical protein ETB97_008862 [Aspergillus alliaceus]|uniref:Uncharacterized protein n=1 Tax=Petromyces alliaceus TaxID=209559 RepID=A0A8H5ZUP5_PETAA|nr:hypothetical protein ETB97_008862 [Aspergillus burnettii]
MSNVDQAIVDEWFNGSNITIGPAADTEERVRQAKRLFYMWKDCFARTCHDIKATDMVEHPIDLMPGATPSKSKCPRYTHHEREFANKILPEMEEAGVIGRMATDRGARTKLGPRQGPRKYHIDDLRLYHRRRFDPFQREDGSETPAPALMVDRPSVDDDGHIRRAESGARHGLSPVLKVSAYPASQDEEKFHKSKNPAKQQYAQGCLESIQGAIDVSDGYSRNNPAHLLSVKQDLA